MIRVTGVRTNTNKSIIPTAAKGVFPNCCRSVAYRQPVTIKFRSAKVRDWLTASSVNYPPAPNPTFTGTRSLSSTLNMDCGFRFMKAAIMVSGIC